jgi:hypothetical protein
MPKGLPTVTEPVSIPVPGGEVLVTTIDPLTKKHHVVCDICKKGVRLMMYIVQGITKIKRHLAAGKAKR